MAIIIIDKIVTPQQIKKAQEDYESYIKLTIDIEGEIIALGGEFHADAEKILLESGSQQKNIWGGGLNLETNLLETNAIINYRGGSAEILDPKVREKFLNIAKKFLGKYVK
jgi:hypothetical protein